MPLRPTNFRIIIIKLYRSKKFNFPGESLNLLILIAEVINNIINIFLAIENARIDKDIIMLDVFIKLKRRGRGRPRKHALSANTATATANTTDAPPTTSADLVIHLQDAQFKASRQAKIAGLVEKGVFQVADL